MSKAKKARAKRPRQTILPGAEDLCLPDLDEAMNEYQATKMNRMELLETEIEEKGKVKELMIEHDVQEYKSIAYGLTAKRVHGEEDVKVKATKATPSDNGEMEV